MTTSQLARMATSANSEVRTHSPTPSPRNLKMVTFLPGEPQRVTSLKMTHCPRDSASTSCLFYLRHLQASGPPFVEKALLQNHHQKATSEGQLSVLPFPVPPLVPNCSSSPWFKGQTFDTSHDCSGWAWPQMLQAGLVLTYILLM